MRQPQTNQTQIAGNNLLSPTGCLIPSFAGGADCFLYSHQKEAIAIDKNLAIWHSCGLGKTRTALEIFKKYKQKDTSLKLIVVCPLSLIYSAWRDDVIKFTDFTFANYKNLKEYDPIPDIIAINYESLISKKYLPKITEAIKNINFMCVLDESQKLRNHKSIISKTMMDLSGYFKHRIILSGSPMPNSEMEIYTQISFLDKSILPKSFYEFRNIYFQFERNGKTITGQTYSRQALRELLMRGWKYTITPTNREKLMKQIAPICHWVKKEDVLPNLPEQVFEIRDVFLSDGELSCYKNMRRDLIAEIAGKEIVAQVAIAKIQKLRQATRGFMYDESGNSHEIGQSKFNILLEILEELGNQQVIIVCQYRHEIKKIEEYLKDKCVTLYSETDDKDLAIKKFKTNEAKYLVCHPLSGGKGLTLINSNAMVFYSLDYSWESNYQMRERIHRIGTKNSCLYIYLLASGTIDVEIFKAIEKKQTLQNIIYNIVNSK